MSNTDCDFDDLLRAFDAREELYETFKQDPDDEAVPEHIEDDLVTMRDIWF